MKYMTFPIIMIAILFFVSTANHNKKETAVMSQNQFYTTIGPGKAKKLVESGDAILLDIRADEQYKKAHIPKSISIPLSELRSKATSKLPSKSINIIICSSNNSNSNACSILRDLGYSNIFDMGNVSDWT